MNPAGSGRSFVSYLITYLLTKQQICCGQVPAQGTDIPVKAADRFAGNHKLNIRGVK
jgi:hypothetical protein